MRGPFHLDSDPFRRELSTARRRVRLCARGSRRPDAPLGSAAMTDSAPQSLWDRVVALTIALGERILAPIERFIGKRSLVGDMTFFPLERFDWVKHIEDNWMV